MKTWVGGIRRALAASPVSALLAAAGAAVPPRPVEVPPTWAGDLWSRSRLTGSSRGLRDTLGESVITDLGAIVPTNTAALVPVPKRDASAPTHATFTQFLGPEFGMFAGKTYTLDGLHGEFPGNHRTRFSNTGPAIPMATALVPISAYGGGVVALPWEDVVIADVATKARLPLQISPRRTRDRQRKKSIDSGVRSDRQATIDPSRTPKTRGVRSRRGNR